MSDNGNGTKKQYSENTKSRFPKKLKEIHEVAYYYYLKLGDDRTYQVVADFIGVNLSTIKSWSLAYEWQERIQKDIEKWKKIGLIEVWGEVGQFRKDGILTVKNLMSWLKGLTEIIESKRRGKRAFSAEEESEIEGYKDALKTFGLSFKNPRDLRDLVSVIGELVDFRPDAGGGTLEVPQDKRHPGGEGITVQGSALILVGLDPKGQNVTALPMRTPEEVAGGDKM